MTYWVSGQSTSKENRSIYEMDSLAFIEGNLGNYQNKYMIIRDNDDDGQDTVGIQPWDNVAGFRGFGYENTDDIFANFSTNLFSSSIFKFKILDESIIQKEYLSANVISMALSLKENFLIFLIELSPPQIILALQVFEYFFVHVKCEHLSFHVNQKLYKMKILPLGQPVGLKAQSS